MNTCDITNIVYKNFERRDIAGIMITGSYAIRMNTDNSDLDIVILSNYACRQTSAEVIEDGLRINFIIMPKVKLYDLVYEDIFSERFVLCSIFEKGVICIDLHGYLHSIKNMLLNIHTVLSEHTINALLHTINEELNYLEHNLDASEVALSAYVHCEQLISGVRYPHVKHLNKAIRTATIYNTLRKTLDNFLVTRDAVCYSSDVKKILSEYIDAPSSYSSSTTLLRTGEKENYMIFIPDARGYEKYVVELLKSIYEHYPKQKLFSFYVGNCGIQSRGFYIALINNKHSSSCIADVQCIVEQKVFHSTPKFLYPYNTIFFNLNVFGDEENKGMIYDIFARSSRIMYLASKNSPNSSDVGCELGFLFTYKLLLLLDSFKSEFVKNSVMIYISDAINITGTAPHCGLVYRYKTFIHELKRSSQFDKTEFNIKVNQIEEKYPNECNAFMEACNNLINVSYHNKKIPYNAHLFTNKRVGILFNVYNIVMSIFSLDNYQKLRLLSICVNS